MARHFDWSNQLAGFLFCLMDVRLKLNVLLLWLIQWCSFCYRADLQNAFIDGGILSVMTVNEIFRTFFSCLHSLKLSYVSFAVVLDKTVAYIVVFDIVYCPICGRKRFFR